MPLACPLLLLFAALGPARAVPTVPADGFYRDAANGDLGQAIHYKIKSAYVISQNNLNTQFYVQFITPFIKLPAGDSDRCVLVVEGRRFEARQTGSSQNTESIYDFFHTLGPEDAARVARFFSVKPRLRKHPGYRLATSFRSLQEFWKPGQKVMLEMTITNVGTETVRFMVGGRNRGARDNQLGFSLLRDNQGVRDTGDSLHFGGLSTPKVLRPGETFERQIDLTQWFDTTPPGVYTGTGTYAVAFVPNEGELDCVWQDVLAGEFYFQRSPK
jgi:hypothetical protein